MRSGCVPLRIAPCLPLKFVNTHTMRTVNIKPLKFVNPHTMRTVNMRIIQDRFQELITRAERVGLLKDDGYDIMTTDEHELGMYCSISCNTHTNGKGKQAAMRAFYTMKGIVSLFEDQSWAISFRFSWQEDGSGDNGSFVGLIGFVLIDAITNSKAETGAFRYES